MKCCLSSLYSNLKNNNLTVSTMESCTAGLLCSKLTNECGASEVIYGGRITYNNEQKIKAGVPVDIINKYGVYSCECAKAMAEAVRKDLGSSVGIGTTGTSGNLDLNNSDSVVGVVYFAFSSDKLTESYCINIPDKYINSKEQSKNFITDIIIDKFIKYIKILNNK